MSNEREHINKELNELESMLHLPANEEGLNVPIAYFETLENEILNKTVYAEKEVSNAVKLRAIPLWKYISGIAATGLILYFGLQMFASPKESLEMQLAKMNTSELDNFISQQIAAISESELHNYLLDNVNDIETVLLFETEFISDATLEQKTTAEVNAQVLSAEKNSIIKVNLLDENLLDQLDDETLQDYLNNAALFDDLGL